MPGLAAVGGGSGTTTFTTSTTRGDTFTFSGGTLGSLSGFFSSPAIRSALQRLNGAGVPSTLAFDHSEFSVTTSTSLGPGTIMIGPDQSVTFFVAAGTTNFNTNTHTQNFYAISLAASTPGVGLVLGDFHAAFQTALLEQNWNALDALFARLRGFGAIGANGAALPWATQFASAADDDLPGGVNLAQAGPGGRMRPTPWFVWARPFGLLGKVDSSSERLGFRYDSAGISAGAEHRWPGAWLAGATLGYAHTGLTQATTSDGGRIESFQIGAYGGYRDQRLHVLAAALFQQNWLSSERFTALGATTAKASYSAQAYSFGIEAGRKYPLPFFGWQAHPHERALWVQPFASLIYTHLRQGGFTESGATLLEIAGSARSVNALKLSLGARAWRDFDLGWGIVTPELRARWVQDLLNERRAITARFVGDATQTAFTVNGAKPTPAAAILGAGVTLRMGPSLKASLGYDAELRRNARSHTIQATLRVVW